jgi:steroid 5-alpha reductase family enzyme
VTSLLATIAAALSLAMTTAWTVVVHGGKSGWIDAIWSFAVGSAGVALALAGGAPTPSPRQILVAALAAAWSLRLGLHIVVRTAAGGDDPRYTRLREEWGTDFEHRLFWLLQLQAAAGLALAGAILAAARNPFPGLRPADGFGAAILVAAIAGEALADRQLARFRADPASHGRICDAGLWGRSRHPNYFFEWLAWLGYVPIAVDLAGGYAWGWASLAGPALMYVLLVHVSGVPPLEAHLERSRGDAFRSYRARVNAFWPGPRR